MREAELHPLAEEGESACEPARRDRWHPSSEPVEGSAALEAEGTAFEELIRIHGGEPSRHVLCRALRSQPQQGLDPSFVGLPLKCGMFSTILAAVH